jgi:hypothetical protein
MTRRLGDATLVIGIPTVSRPRDYLLETIDSIVAGIPEHSRGRVEVVIFNAEVPSERHSAFARLRTRYRRLVDAGFLTLMTAPGPHPELAEQRIAGRVRRQQLGSEYWNWEARLVLDAARIMEICRPRADYYLHLEDDVVVAENFYDELVRWFDARFAARDDWAALCLTPLEAMNDGDRLPPASLRSTASLFFRAADLSGVIEYLRAIHGELPLDHAFAQRLIDRGEAMYVRAPALVQHVGLLSSRAGVFRTHESPSFADPRLARARRRLREVRDVLTVSPRFIWRLLRMRGVLSDATWHTLNRVRRAVGRRGQS